MNVAGNWYVAIVNPNCHKRAATELAALGYRAFYPKLRKWVSHARTKVPKEYPILGRYLFIDIHDLNFFTVRAVNGIEGLLTGDRGEPALVPRAQVMNFETRYHAGEWDAVLSNPIPIGARVRIIKGEFAQMLVTILGRRRGRLEFLPPGRSERASIREQGVWAA